MPAGRVQDQNQFIYIMHVATCRRLVLDVADIDITDKEKQLQRQKKWTYKMYLK